MALLTEDHVLKKIFPSKIVITERSIETKNEIARLMRLSRKITFKKEDCSPILMIPKTMELPALVQTYGHILTPRRLVYGLDGCKGDFNAKNYSHYSCHVSYDFIIQNFHSASSGWSKITLVGAARVPKETIFQNLVKLCSIPFSPLCLTTQGKFDYLFYVEKAAEANAIKDCDKTTIHIESHLNMNDDEPKEHKLNIRVVSSRPPDTVMNNKGNFLIEAQFLVLLYFRRHLSSNVGIKPVILQFFSC